MITNDGYHQEGKPRPWAVGAFSGHMASRSAPPCLQRGTSPRCGRYSSDHRTPHMWRNAQKNCHRAAKTRVSHWSPLFPPLPEYYGQLAVSGDCRWNKRILQSLHQNSIRIQISFHKFRASYTTRDRISRKGVDTICVQVLKVACRF